MNLLHPAVKTDFIDYLIAAGYSLIATNPKGLPQFAQYSTLNHRVIFSRHRARIEKNNGVIFEAVLSVELDVANLDAYTWALILDAAGAVSLKKVIAQIPEADRLDLLARISDTISVPVNA